MEGHMTTELFDEKCCSNLIKQEGFLTVCKQEVIINDIHVENEELDFSEEELFDETNIVKEINNEEVPYDWNERVSTMELKYQNIPKVESTCREENTKYSHSPSSAVNVVVTREGEKLMEVKQEYSDTEVRTEELLNVENNMFGDITKENILINGIKVENEEIELDEVNTVDSNVEKEEEEMDFDWNDSVRVGPDPLALGPVVQNNIKTECINEGGTGAKIETSSRLQEGNDMVQCDQDGSSSFTMLTQHKDQKMTYSQINLISDCKTLKKINSCLKEKPFNVNKVYKCSLCSYTVVGSLCGFKDHMRVHSLPKLLKCSQCNYYCARSYDLKNHIRVHSRKKTYKCLQCDYSSPWSSCLKNHMYIHTNEKPFKCLQCDYSCGRPKYLKVHMTVHSSKKPFKCLQCDYSSAWSSCLKQHMSIHTNEKPFKCLQCDYSCGRSAYLKKHMTATHTSEKPLKCDYSFAGSSNRRKHMTVHTSENPFKCLQCDYFTAWSSCLKAHMTVHTGVKPFKCLQCDYSSAWSSCLKQHITVHTGDKPFKCLQCDYSATTSSNLRKHMTVHTGEKPLKCLQCDYSSARSADLKRHMIVHTGEKPL